MIEFTLFEMIKVLRLKVLHFREIRECLKLDQDHKECHTHYKKVKKLVKQLNQAQDLINEGTVCKIVVFKVIFQNF